MRTVTAVAALFLAVLAGPALAEEGDSQRDFERGFYKEMGERDLEGAIRAYQKVVERDRAGRAVAAKALLRIGLCQEKLGRTSEARKTFGRVLEDFATQTRICEQARLGLARLGRKAASRPGLKAGKKGKAGQPAARRGLEKPMSVDFTDTPLSAVLGFLREAGGVNIVLDPNIKKSEDELMVQIQVSDIPLRQLLDLVLNMRGLSWVQLHGVVYVAEADAIGRYWGLTWDGAGTIPPDLRRVVGKLGRTRVSMDFTDRPFAAVLQYLKMASGLDFQLSSEAESAVAGRTVNLQVDSLVLKEVLGLLTRFNNLAWTVDGGRIRIWPATRAPLPDPNLPTLEKLLTKRITVDFQDTKLEDIFSFLRSVAGLNLVLTDDALAIARQKTATLAVNDLVLENVLRLLAMPRGLDYALQGGVVRIQVRAPREVGPSAGGDANLKKHIQRLGAAVSAGLFWLKQHQNEDGSWSGTRFMSHCRTGPCSGKASSPDYDAGLTGLATLAFLGAGHTHKQGKFQATVSRALKHLAGRQDGEGCLDRTGTHWFYNHAVGTLALAEACGMTGAKGPLRSAAQRAVDFLVRCQNPGMGWRYGVKPGDNDTSCTTWAVLALKSAKIAGLTVPETAFQGALAWYDRVTDERYHKTGYTSKGDSGARLASATKYPPQEAMSAAAIVGRILLGRSRKSARNLGAGTLLMKSLPRWVAKKNVLDGNGRLEAKRVSPVTVDMYYWYFGSLAAFQLGGQYWKAWYPAVTSALLTNQRRRGCIGGSWDPVGAWGAAGGRVYATAICTLTMEICYRYKKVGGK